MTDIVLVLDANERSALAVTRSIGKHPDITVLTSDETVNSLAGASKFSTRYLRSPSPTNHPGKFIDWLIDTIRTERITQVFPVTEITTYTCLMHREILKPCRLPFPDLTSVQTIANKCRLLKLGRDLDIPYPVSCLVSKASEFNPGSIDRFPIVIKPCFSRILVDNAWLSTSVHIANSEGEVTTLLETKPYLRHHPFMVQEYIPGAGAGVFALYHHGRAVTFFWHKRIREKPPTGGVSVVSESAPLDPILVSMAQRLLDHVEWHGVAMVEFRITPDKTPFLMEVNPRFWGSLQLAIDCGIDFPYLLFEMNTERELDTPAGYSIGRRLRWLLGDLDSLYLYLRDRDRFSYREKLQRVKEFFTPAFSTTRHEVNRLSDLGPARYELRKYLHDIIRRD